MSQNKVPEKVQEAFFNKLLSIPSNNECADCKNKSPSWVSLEFGVFVCIRCSGVHRQLGPHITRVRSTRLDGWVQENMNIMSTVGNKIANDFYEHRLPSNVQRPGPNSSMEDCRKFIDAKYIKKIWHATGYQEPVKEFQNCQKSGATPDFGYSQGGSNAHVSHDNNPELKVVRKRSLSLESKPKTQQHQDLLGGDHDLLSGATGAGSGTHDDFGDFKSAHAHSASPHHNKGGIPEVKQDTTQWNWGLANNNTTQTTQAGNSNNLTDLYGASTTNNAQPQQQKNTDVMSLYGQSSQSTMHQNHFMGGMGMNNQQAWGQLGYNNANMGMQQGGMQGGWGNMNQNMQQGGFQNNFGAQQQRFPQQNMGGFNQQQNMGQMGGFGGNNMGMGFNQGYPNNQFGGNQFQQNNTNNAFGWK